SDGPDESVRHLLNHLPELSLPFIQFIPLSHRRGPAAARNAGWRAASGSLIAFTADDCLPSPQWLAAYWRAYQRCGRRYTIAFSGNTRVPVSDEPTDFEINTSHLEHAEFITANCVCSRPALQLVG